MDNILLMWMLNVLCLCFLFIFAFIDIKQKIIPNKLVLCGIAAGLFLSILSMDLDFILSRLIGFIFALIITFLASYLSKGGIGMGDVKLMSFVGLCMGFGELTGVFFMALALSVIYGIIMVILKRADKKTLFPFAPFVFLGAVIHLTLVIIS